MKITLAVYANSDDALLLWTADRLDDGLEGFSIQRKLKRGRAAEVTKWLDNYAPPGPRAYQNGVLAPSNERPFRTFSWTDHSVGDGDRVRYRIAPFFAGTTEPSEELATAWSDEVTLGWPRGATHRAFFNRGFVISQFVSRYLDEHYPGMNRIAALKAFKEDLTGEIDNTFRVFLSGQVRTELTALLDEVAAGNGSIYAALFELEDQELVDHLTPLGSRAHVVLANGSIQVKKDPKALETTEQARKRDENKSARRQLRKAGVDVEAKNRFVSPGALAHNKFLVVVDPNGTARRVWTGSTNWTTTGLCTQLNNALLIDDKDIAAAYLAQWHALRDAKSEHPASLAKSNGTPTDLGDTDPPRASVHFTRAPKKSDLAALRQVVNGAKEGVLFLMFIPGATGVLADVLALRAAKPELLVRGVVSELPKGRQDEKTGDSTTVKVTIVGATPDQNPSETFEVVQPEGKTHPTGWWAAETAHWQFLKGVGHAIIHSKVLVVDPFGDDPTVVTGSHNFSNSASTTNDENFVIIRGDRALAEAYAVNVDSAWRHYAYRVGNPHPELTGIDYLRALLADQRREEHFWRLA